MRISDILLIGGGGEYQTYFSLEEEEVSLLRLLSLELVESDSVLRS